MDDSIEVQIKPPLLYEEQLELLKMRGLVVLDDNDALEILKRVSYYRLTAYTLTFKKMTHFIQGPHLSWYIVIMNLTVS